MRAGREREEIDKMSVKVPIEKATGGEEYRGGMIRLIMALAEVKLSDGVDPGVIPKLKKGPAAEEIPTNIISLLCECDRVRLLNGPLPDFARQEVIMTSAVPIWLFLYKYYVCHDRSSIVLAFRLASLPLLILSCIVLFLFSRPTDVACFVNRSQHETQGRILQPQ